MTINKLEFKKIEDVKTKGTFVKAICYKPMFAIVICFIAGIGVCFINSFIAKILGMFFMLMSVIVFKLIKDYKIIDIFSEGVLLYKDENNDEAYFAAYDEILTWDVNRVSNHDILVFNLKDGASFEKDCYQSSKAISNLKKYIKEKQISYIESEKIKKNINDFPTKLKERIKKIINK